MNSILYWVVLVAIMLVAWYFLMIRPQRRKVKEHEAMMKALKPGARVITVAGIYGEIDSVSEETMVLKLEDGARMKVSRASIAGLEPVIEPDEEEEEAQEDGAAEGEEVEGGEEAVEGKEAAEGEEAGDKP